MTRGAFDEPRQKRTTVTERFKVGDHVTWNSEAGYVSGTIIKVHAINTRYKVCRAVTNQASGAAAWC